VRIQFILCFCFQSVSYWLSAQTAPLFSDSICSFAPYVDSSGVFPNAGYSVGTTVPNFILYDSAGVPHSLYSYLGQGKPVVLISGSYTCPQYRNSLLNLIPQMDIAYGSLINILLVYTLEAHPELPWNSPYAYGPWVAGINVTNGISFAQHQIYYDRLNMMDTTMANCPVNHVQLADDTCNTWLSTFGPAPNMTYVLSENGVVRGKFGLGWNEKTNVLRTIDIELGLFTTSVSTTSENQPKLINHPSPQTILQTGYTTAWQITITDLFGRKVFEAANLSPAEPFEFARLSLMPGTYIVLLNNGQHTLNYTQL
jgi:Iodothyronine deiodinase